MIKDDTIYDVDFFEFNKIFFTDRKKYKRLANSIKNKYGYKLLNRLVIGYPVQINAVQKHLSPALIDGLHEQFCQHAMPKFMYTPTPKVNTSAIEDYHVKIREYFCKSEDIEFKHLELMYNHNPSYTIEGLERAKKILTEKIKKSKKKKKFKM